jgi:DNA-binding XRE family transcriptional regulator
VWYDPFRSVRHGSLIKFCCQARRYRFVVSRSGAATLNAREGDSEGPIMSPIMSAPAPTFAARLKAAMAAAHQTQRSLAAAIGVSQATVSSWCVGRTVPGFDDACRLAHLLGVSMESLCDPSWHGEEEEQP